MVGVNIVNNVRGDDGRFITEVVKICLVAVSGGFIFGYDIGITGILIDCY